MHNAILVYHARLMLLPNSPILGGSPHVFPVLCYMLLVEQTTQALWLDVFRHHLFVLPIFDSLLRYPSSGSMLIVSSRRLSR
jgi:hypothetical protein